MLITGYCIKSLPGHYLPSNNIFKNMTGQTDMMSKMRYILKEQNY